MKALVTGAAGFIGGALAQALLADGWELILPLRPARQPPWTHPRARWLPLDLAQNAPLPPELTAGVDLAYHAAAIRNRWGTSPQAYQSANVAATARLAAACRGRVARLVYLSSVGAMDFPPRLDIDERFPLRRPGGPLDYHASKAAAERLLQQEAGLPTVIVRPTITYGPGDRDGMLPRLAALIARGGYVQVGAGTNTLHLTHIDDLVRGLRLAGTHPAAAGETFIFAGPQPVEVRALIALLAARLGRPAPRLWVPIGAARGLAWGLEQLWRVGRVAAPPPLTNDKIDVMVKRRGFSWQHAAQVLGYQPQVALPDGLDATLAWLRAVDLLPRPAPAPAQERDHV